MIAPCPVNCGLSFQIRLDHVDHFIGSPLLLRTRSMLSVEHVTAYVPLQKFSHQTVHGSPRRTHYLENVGALAFFGERTHQGFDLTLNAFGP